MARRAYYVLSIALPDGRVVAAADCGLETDERGRHRYSALRYRTNWLQEPRRFALNPVHAPLRGESIEWRSEAIPAVLDELVPGHWQRMVLARYWQQSGRARDVADLHALFSAPRSAFRVGAVEIRPAAEELPQLDSAITLDELEDLASHAERVTQNQDAEIAALKRLQAGSSVGGARPKLVVRDTQATYIAKLNRADDAFNYARVEHFALELARRGGLDVPPSHLARVGDFDVVLVERFDVTHAGGRYHLVSANALLKDTASQADPIHARYDDLIGLIRHCSDHVAADLRQLYGQMLFNEAINNQDDHLRNFSFRQTEQGLHLSPAYDLVPSDLLGGYPNLSFGHASTRPVPGSDAAYDAAKAFQLRPREARRINEQLRQALNEPGPLMDAAGLGDRDRRLLARVIRPAGMSE